MLIALGHRKRVGKDTAAEYLMQHYGFKRVASADQVKLIASIAFGLSADQLYGNQKEVIDRRWNKTPRQIMQDIGQGLRAIHPNIWGAKMLQRVDELLQAGEHVVVTDVRFPNEADALRMREAFLYRINRPAVFDALETDVSETALDHYPYWYKDLDNDMHIPYLYEQLDNEMKGQGIQRIE